MKQQISDNERRELQLQMLDEIQEVCEKNEIKYSLSCGTLLGAIRHGGFIPWDDDMDIMMPYHDMIRFSEVLNSTNIVYKDARNDNCFEWFFSRIVSKHTYSRKGKFVKEYGVNIDLYPVVSIPDETQFINRYLLEGEELNIVANNKIKWRRRAMRYLSLRNIPGFNKAVNNLRNHVFSYADVESSTFFVTSGSFKMHNVFKKDLWEDTVKVKFEDRQYCVCKEYDAYLSQVYGNYMLLPPEKDRHPYHGETYYWIK